MRGGAAAEVEGARRAPVGVEPLTSCLLRLLPVFAPWALVVAGRSVCLLAQRLPPAVRLVHTVQERRARAAA